MSPEQLQHTGLCAGQPGLRGLQYLDRSCGAPPLGPALEGRQRGGCSLIPAGPSLSLFGHLLVLQQHINDEHSHKQEQQEAGGQWDGNSIGSGQEILVDNMLAVDEWQENHPGGVVGEDDQANGDEPESHHLVCPRGMENVFELPNPAMLANKHILLVDDVITTGATLEACGSVLLKAPGSKISIAAVAYTI